MASQIFSPGLDGQNDQLKFTIEGTCDLEVSIYDRWGVEVFQPQVQIKLGMEHLMRVHCLVVLTSLCICPILW